MSERRALDSSRREGGNAVAVRSAEREAARALETVRRRGAAASRSLGPKRRASRLLIGEREHRLYPLNPAKIEYIEARGNYVALHASGLVFLCRDSISHLSRVLANRSFIRIQRAILLNLRSIQYAEPAGRGRYHFTLSSGERVCSGTRYRDEILMVLPLTRAERLSDS